MNVSILIAILIGWIIALLVNYLADVLPLTRSFSPATCTNCAQKFTLTDYMILRPCRQCGKRRNIRTWIVLLGLVGISMYIWINPPSRLGYVISMILVTYLALVFVIDVEHRLILHPTSIVGSVLGLGVGWLKHGLVSALLGGLAGLLIMYTLYYLGVLFSRFRARRLQQAGLPTDDEEALGAGDVILAGILGLTLGWPLIWFGLLLGILLGGAYGILLVVFMLISKRYKGNALMVFMPYGPFFVISTFFILFLPNWIATLVPK